MVFEQFFTDPPPEGESAKVPPAGSHFGRYFGTLLFGGSPRSGRQCSIDFRQFPCKKHKKWQWDKRFSNRRYSKDHPNVEGFILGFLVIWTTFALCNIFYLKSVWPHPQKASSIWNNSWISSIITVLTIREPEKRSVGWSVVDDHAAQRQGNVGPRPSSTTPRPLRFVEPPWTSGSPSGCDSALIDDS